MTFHLLPQWQMPIAASWLYSAICFLLAVIVVIDVLLKKSDVRSALGWIGAVWLAPVLGALLYFMFGINRVTRRAAKLSKLDEPQISLPESRIPDAVPDNIRQLAGCGERITDSPLTDGNGITILQGGDTAYPAMVSAIRNAKACVALASYIFRDDAAGRQFSEALIDAHHRGVQVRVLLDSIGSGYIASPMIKRLTAAKVPAARFLHTWLPWRMPFLNMRNHKKLLVVDGTVAFVGGMNIGAEDSKKLTKDKRIEDIHFCVQGPVVRSVMDAFARDWSFTTNETLDDECWWHDLSASGTIYTRGLRSGPDSDIYKIESILGAALMLARKRVRVVTPYFLPDQRIQFAISQACLRGVEVEIVLPERSDYTLMDWAVRGHLRFFNHIPANIYLSPAPFDHSKLVTVDGEWSLIGSSNWDTRSLRLNFEYDLECYEKQFAADLDAIIDKKISRAGKLNQKGLAHDPILIRLRNAAARLLLPYL